MNQPLEDDCADCPKESCALIDGIVWSGYDKEVGLMPMQKGDRGKCEGNQL